MAQRKGTSRGRRGQAAKAPVIELEASEVAEEAVSTPSEETQNKTEDDVATKAEETVEDEAKSQDGDAPQEAETISSSAAENPERPGRGKLIAAGVAALLLTGAAGGAWLYRDMGADYFPPAAYKIHAEKLVNLQGKIDTLEASNTAAATALTQLTSEMEALKKQIQSASETIKAQGTTLETTAARADEAATLAQQADALAKAATETIESVKTTTGQAVNMAESALKASQQADAELKTAQSGIDELKTAIASAAANASSVTGDASESAKAAQAQISGLTLKLAELEGKLANTAPALPDPVVAERVSALDSAIAALRTEFAKVVEGTKSDTARAAQSAEVQTKRDQMLQALNELTSNAETGQPYAAALAVLQPALSAEPAFQALSEAAATGVPDSKSLIAAFSEVHSTLTQGSGAATQEPADGSTSEPSSLLSSLQNRLASVIKIRPSGTADWGKLADRMAEQAKRGQLGEMVQIAGDVTEAPPEALAAWLKTARARLALDQNISALSIRAMEQLAQTGKTGG